MNPTDVQISGAGRESGRGDGVGERVRKESVINTLLTQITTSKSENKCRAKHLMQCHWHFGQILCNLG